MADAGPWYSRTGLLVIAENALMELVGCEIESKVELRLCLEKATH
jgi:hypothetical protein